MIFSRLFARPPGPNHISPAGRESSDSFRPLQTRHLRVSPASVKRKPSPGLGFVHSLSSSDWIVWNIHSP